MNKLLTIKSFNEINKIPDSDEYKAKRKAILKKCLKPVIILKKIDILRVSENLRKTCVYIDILEKKLEILRCKNQNLPKSRITIKCFTELLDSDEYTKQLADIQKDNLNPDVDIEIQFLRCISLRYIEDLRKSCIYINALEEELQFLRHQKIKSYFYSIRNQYDIPLIDVKANSSDYNKINSYFYSNYGKELIDWIFNPINMTKWGHSCWDLI